MATKNTPAAASAPTQGASDVAEQAIQIELDRVTAEADALAEETRIAAERAAAQAATQEAVAPEPEPEPEPAVDPGPETYEVLHTRVGNTYGSHDRGTIVTAEELVGEGLSAKEAAKRLARLLDLGAVRSTRTPVAVESNVVELNPAASRPHVEMPTSVALADNPVAAEVARIAAEEAARQVV